MLPCLLVFSLISLNQIYVMMCVEEPAPFFTPDAAAPPRISSLEHVRLGLLGSHPEQRCSELRCLLFWKPRGAFS